MDAVRVAAGAALLLTALEASGCGRAKHAPEAPPPPPAARARVATLRVGVPAISRANLLFTCDGLPGLQPAPHLGSASYAADSLDPSRRTWLRARQPDSDTAGTPAPDTLIVRSFGDATDEEIALERGELDVAVFWPGEPSARIRSDARFRDPELGIRSLGVLACGKSDADTLGPPRADMELLNREAFAGDLMPWSELVPDSLDGPPARYMVAHGLPGAQHLERILARIPSTGATRTLWLYYVHQPPGLFSTLPPPTPAYIVRGGPPKAVVYQSGLKPLFAIRCPVLTRPGSRDVVRAIGAGAFADLAPCSAESMP